MRQDLLDKYAAEVSPDNAAAYIAIARRYLQTIGSATPNAENIRAWIKKLQARGFADSTISKYWNVVHRVCTVNSIPWPFQRGQGPTIREKTLLRPGLDSYDIRHLVFVLTGREPAMNGVAPRPEQTAFFALSTIYGARRIEMQELGPDNFDWKHATLFIETKKHGRQRYHLIPPEIQPYLEVWGFTHQLSPSSMSHMFHELLAMINWKDRGDIGWHSIRRALTSEAEKALIPRNLIESFCRWKVDSTNMASRYANVQIVGTRGTYMEVSGSDIDKDREMFVKHPFLPFWKEVQGG